MLFSLAFVDIIEGLNGVTLIGFDLVACMVGYFKVEEGLQMHAIVYILDKQCNYFTLNIYYLFTESRI